MDRKSTDRPLNSLLPLLLLGGLALSSPLDLAAQVPVDENGSPLEALDPYDYNDEPGLAVQSMTSAELEELVGPIALYPDDLLAIVLPASTYPLEIVQAARFLDELGTDSSLKPDETWDESVIALLNYPEVVYMMDKEIDWTWRLGEAVISQQPEILAAVESFRDRAYAAGNLESDQHQTVSNYDGVIEIAPADEEIIYVPYYEPEQVVVYQPRPVYYYYPHAYPVYYYPYPVGYSFASGYFWGVTTAYTIGWSNRNLHVYHPTYWGHPYYGRYYNDHYYRRPSIAVYNNWYVHNSYRSKTNRHRDGDHWRPRKRGGARPESRSVRNWHNRSDEARNQRSDVRQAYNDRYNRNSSQRHRADNNDRVRSIDTASRTRQSSSAERARTEVANRDKNRRNQVSSSDFRFRDRSDADRARANRSSDSARRNNSGQSNSRQRNNDATVSNERQRLAAQNTRQADASSRKRNRQGNQRNNDAAVSNKRQRQVAQSTRQATASSRTSNRQSSQRNDSSRQPSATRAATRRTNNRQSTARSTAQQSAQRQNVQRQAPAQRQSSRASQQRQSSGRQSAPSNKRGQSHNRKKKK